MIEKRIVNESGDFKILYNGRWVGYRRTAEVFKKDEDLSDKVNPDIIKEMSKATVIDYTPPPEPTIEQKKNIKADKYRAVRDDSITYDNQTLPISALDLFESLPAFTDDQILSLLPIKTETDYLIDTVEKVRGISYELMKHRIDNNNDVIDCLKATDIDSIPDPK